MKPNTINEIFSKIKLTPVTEITKIGSCVVSEQAYTVADIDSVKQQLIELFMSCVPKHIEEFKIEFTDADGGWNDCRDQMIKNLEKLK